MVKPFESVRRTSRFQRKNSLSFVLKEREEKGKGGEGKPATLELRRHEMARTS